MKFSSTILASAFLCMSLLSGCSTTSITDGADRTQTPEYDWEAARKRNLTEGHLLLENFLQQDLAGPAKSVVVTGISGSGLNFAKTLVEYRSVTIHESRDTQDEIRKHYANQIYTHPGSGEEKTARLFFLTSPKDFESLPLRQNEKDLHIHCRAPEYRSRTVYVTILDEAFDAGDKLYPAP